MIEPLEEAQGKRLNGPGRSDVMAAYDDEPVGVRRCAEDVLSRFDQGIIASPLGLLITMVRKGDHLRAPRNRRRPRSKGLSTRDIIDQALETAAQEQDRKPGPCFKCEVVDEDEAIYRYGQWWCRDHRAEAA